MAKACKQNTTYTKTKRLIAAAKAKKTKARNRYK